METNKVPQSSTMYHTSRREFHEVRVSGFSKVLWSSPRFSEASMDLKGFSTDRTKGSTRFADVP